MDRATHPASTDFQRLNHHFMSDQFRRSLNVECRILSEADGLVEYIASDATLDSYNEVILPSGWQFNLFRKNAPFVDSHNYWSIEYLLGQVEGARMEGGQLIERVRWAKDVQESKLCQLGWKMTLGGFLKAVSVGFRPIKAASPGDAGWNAYVSEAALSPEDAQRTRRIFVKQEQLELSACVLGANPSAVAKAYHDGCIKDADLAGVGFQDSDLQFLTVAGRALEAGKCDDLTRVLIGREMERITAPKNNQRNAPASSNSHSSGKPGGDEMARRQAEGRDQFLRQLGTLVDDITGRKGNA
jgi:hypothetical protein